MEQYSLPVKKPRIIALLDNTFVLIPMQNHPDYQKWIKNSSLHLMAYEDDREFNFSFLHLWYANPLFIRQRMNFGINSYTEQIYEKYFIDIIVEKIADGFYVILDLDEYYLPYKDAYNKFHFPHISFIFGYDKINQIFSTVGYDDKETYRQIDYKFSDILTAHLCAENKYIDFVKHNEEQRFEFSAERFFLDLKSFLYGKNIDDYFLNRVPCIYNFLLYHRPEKSYGIYAEKKVVLYLEDLIETTKNQGFREIDIRIFRVLLEHKDIMLEGLQYIFTVYQIGSEVLIKKYRKNIYEQAKGIFNLSLKYHLRKNIHTLEQIKDRLNSFIQEEYNILEDIWNCYEDKRELGTK